MAFDLGFLGTATPWLALIGFITGIAFLFQAKAKGKSLLFPMLGFGMIALVTGVATIPYIGSWIAPIFGLFSSFAIGMFSPFAMGWAYYEGADKMKKAFKMG